MQYQYTHISLAFGFFLNVLSSSQNRINIRISKIYTTSVINVIVTFIQSTLSKTPRRPRGRARSSAGAEKIEGHFGIDYRQDFCVVHAWSVIEDKYPTCTYETTLTTQTTMIEKLREPSRTTFGHRVYAAFIGVSTSSSLILVSGHLTVTPCSCCSRVLVMVNRHFNKSQFREANQDGKRCPCLIFLKTSSQVIVLFFLAEACTLL